MPKSRTDWKRVDRLTDAAIAKSIVSDPDTFEPSPAFWKKARVVLPPKKAAVTIKLDRDVLEFFRRHGRGYQTRINAVLRSYVEAQDR
jgi:uncharacterized protein (DUF4415 family)